MQRKPIAITIHYFRKYVQCGHLLRDSRSFLHIIKIKQNSPLISDFPTTSLSFYQIIVTISAVGCKLQETMVLVLFKGSIRFKTEIMTQIIFCHVFSSKAHLYLGGKRLFLSSRTCPYFVDPGINTVVHGPKSLASWNLKFISFSSNY